MKYTLKAYNSICQALDFAQKSKDFQYNQTNAPCRGDGTEEGYQDTDLFVDESVDTAEQAICNLLMADLHRALQQLPLLSRSG